MAYFTSWKHFSNLTIFRGYPWNIFETEIRGMFFEYSWNTALWLLEFAKRSTLFSSNHLFLTQKSLFHWEFVKKYFPWKCSVNVPWMSGTLQRWGNAQRIFPEYCLLAGHCYRSSLLAFSDTPRVGFELAQNLLRLCWMKLCSNDNHYTMVL